MQQAVSFMETQLLSVDGDAHPLKVHSRLQSITKSHDHHMMYIPLTPQPLEDSLVGGLNLHSPSPQPQWYPIHGLEVRDLCTTYYVVVHPTFELPVSLLQEGEGTDGGEVRGR